MRDVGKLTNVHHVVFILQHCRYNDDIALLPHSTATATATTATTITTTTTTTTTCTTGNKTRLNGACYKLLNKIIHYVKQIKKKKFLENYISRIKSKRKGKWLFKSERQRFYQECMLAQCRLTHYAAVALTV